MLTCPCPARGGSRKTQVGKPPLGSFIKFRKQGKGFCLGSVPYDLLSRKLQAGKK